MSKKRGLWDTEITHHYGPIYPPAALQPWQQPIPPEPPPLSYGLRETPAGRVGTLESDVWVPTMQAVFVGMAWGAVVGIGAGIVVMWQDWPWWSAAVAVSATWASVTAWHLTAGVRLRQSLLWKREEVERRDLDGDGHIGRPPEVQPVTVRVEVEEPASNRMQFVNLDVDPDRLRTLARAVLNGRSLSEAEWTGAGRPFSRSEFRDLRGKLFDGGLVRWVNTKSKAQGVALTLVGKTVFQRLADLSPTVLD